MKTTIYTTQSGPLHDPGDRHPERIERLQVLHELFKEACFDSVEKKMIHTPADEELLLLAHSYNYVQWVKENRPQNNSVFLLDQDTIMNEHSWGAALEAVEAVCDAVSRTATGEINRAFCAVRPPGHHATPQSGMGFCLFNTVFIGARYAQEHHGIRKVAIVDFDVHHGNGTDEMTRAHDGSIFFVSSHQYPFWPMTGVEEDNDDTVMNINLPARTTGKDILTYYTKMVFPALEAFAPDLLMISAGFDAHKDDPLGGLSLESEDYNTLTQGLSAIANRHAKGRMISVLEGGYNLGALKDSVREHLKALFELSPH